MLAGRQWSNSCGCESFDARVHIEDRIAYLWRQVHERLCLDGSEVLEFGEPPYRFELVQCSRRVGIYFARSNQSWFCSRVLFKVTEVEALRLQDLNLSRPNNSEDASFTKFLQSNLGIVRDICKSVRHLIPFQISSNGCEPLVFELMKFALYAEKRPPSSFIRSMSLRYSPNPAIVESPAVSEGTINVLG